MIQSEVFAPDADSARRSRLFVLAHLDHVPAPTLAVVELLTSELATNAVRHAGTSFTVTVEQLDHEIRVAVTDGSSAAPTPRAPSPAEPSGRGLLTSSMYSRTAGVQSSVTMQRPPGSRSARAEMPSAKARVPPANRWPPLPGTNSPSQRDGRGYTAETGQHRAKGPTTVGGSWHL